MKRFLNLISIGLEEIIDCKLLFYNTQMKKLFYDELFD